MSNINNKGSYGKKMSKAHYSILGVIIVALVVGHFLTQISFIGNSDRGFEESLAKVKIPESEIVQPQPIVEENFQTISTPQVNNDVILTQKKVETEKNVQAIKVVQKEQRQVERRVPEVVVERNPVKEKVKSVAKSERLRQAEKLLTGF